MTEIPEHLLKRSKERRSAMGLPGGEGGEAAADAPASDAPAAAVEAAPSAAPAAARSVEPAAPPPPPPVPPYVEAALTRKRIPFWAMSVIALLPFWGLLYWQLVRVPPAGDDPLVLGGEIYAASCAGCHGATGGGGVGAQLSDGEVLKTYPEAIDMMMWIHLGADAAARPDGSYGDPEREGGPRNVADLEQKMPGFGTDQLDAAQLSEVTRYVREVLSGEETPDQETIDTYEVLAEEAITASEDGQLPNERADAEEAAG